MTRAIAFDSDVVIYAASPDHPRRRHIQRLLLDESTIAVGSVVLLVEVMAKPLRTAPASTEAADLESLLSRIHLRDFDSATSRLALGYAVEFNLRVADAAHLATAVASGADAFLTNNKKDFPKAIAEIEILYPEDLP